MISKLLTLHNPAHLRPESDTSCYLKYKKREKKSKILESSMLQVLIQILKVPEENTLKVGFWYYFCTFLFQQLHDSLCQYCFSEEKQEYRR